MGRVDLRDVIAGGLLMLIGTFVSVYSLTNYSTGTLRRMGPGMFPSAVGAILALFGVAILVNALRTRGSLPAVDLRAVASITGGMVLFALLARPVGLVAAIFALTACSVLAGPKRGVASVLMLATALSGLAVAIFHIGLGIALPILPEF